MVDPTERPGALSLAFVAWVRYLAHVRSRRFGEVP